MENNNQNRELNNQSTAEHMKDLIISSLERDKAEDIKLISLAGKADFAHYIVIASGRSTKHVSSIAEKLLFDLKQHNYGPASVEGRNESSWLLIDALDVVVHVFTPEVRINYSLEEIWGHTANLK